MDRSFVAMETKDYQGASERLEENGHQQPETKIKALTNSAKLVLLGGSLVMVIVFHVMIVVAYE